MEVFFPVNYEIEPEKLWSGYEAYTNIINSLLEAFTIALENYLNIQILRFRLVVF